VLDVADHSHDLAKDRLVPLCRPQPVGEPPPEGGDRDAPEVAADEGGVDEDDRRRAVPVPLPHVAAGEERDPHRVAIARPDPLDLDLLLVAGLDGRLALEPKRPGSVPAGERQVGDRSRRKDAGKRAHAGEDGVVEGEDALRLRVALLREEQPRGEDAVRVEAEAATLQVQEGADEETRSDEEDEGEGDLGRHQGPEPPAAPRDDAPRGGLEGLAAADRDGVRRRHRGGDQGDEERGAEGEGHDGAVDGDGFDLRQREVGDRGREESGQAARDPGGEGQGQTAAGAGQEQPLGERLPEKAAPARAEGDADGELVPTSGGPRHGEASQVGAGGEEDEAHRAGEGVERCAGVAAHVLVERACDEPAAAQRVGPRRLELLLDVRDRAARVGQGSAFPQPRHHPHEPGAGVVAAGLRQVEGGPQLDPEGMDEPRRHHADDRVGVPRERDRAADDRRVASELARPQAVGEDGHPLSSRAVLSRREDAPEKRGPSQQGEEVRAEAVADDRLGLAPSRDRVRRVDRSPDRLEHVRPRPEGPPDWRRHRGVHAVRSPVPHPHEPFRLAERERAQERLPDDSDDGGGPADADRERRHDDERVTRREREGARGVVQVTQDGWEAHGKRGTTPRASPPGAAKPSCFVGVPAPGPRGTLRRAVRPWEGSFPAADSRPRSPGESR
jgi:hypothetical protein